MERRSFFKQIIVLALSIFSAQALAQEEKRRPKKPEKKEAGKADAKGAGKTADLSLPLANPNEEPAKALRYVHSKADVKDAALKTDRMSVKWDDQFCKNCMFYVEAGKKDGAVVGTCQLIPKKLVKAEGWCNSWAKKA